MELNKTAPATARELEQDDRGAFPHAMRSKKSEAI